MTPINPTWIIILGIYTMAWGLWILSPYWAVFSTAGLYSIMAQFSPFNIDPEYIFGTIAFVAGAIITRGAIKPSYQNIQMGAFMGFLHWFLICTLYFMGDWHNTGGITALVFATYCAIVWVNIKVNRRHFDE